jgi:hypothetical protein
MEITTYSFQTVGVPIPMIVDKLLKRGIAQNGFMILFAVIQV